jgi:hypothetical protein
VQAGAALLFLVLLARLALLLGSTPVGGMTQEILYLRSDVFRPLVWVVLAFLLLEAAALILPVVAASGVVPEAFLDSVDTFLRATTLVRALLLLVIGIGLFLAFQRYSRRSLERLEALARKPVEAIASRVTRQKPPERGPRASR